MTTATEYGSGDIEFEMPPGAAVPDRPFYTAKDIAEIGAEVRRAAEAKKPNPRPVEPVKTTTISQHLFESQPVITLRAGGTRPGKFYAKGDPFPAPDDYIGKVPWWDRGRRDEIVEWFERHPPREKGDGVGGVRPKWLGAKVETITVQRDGDEVIVKAGRRTERFDAAVLDAAVKLRGKFAGRPVMFAAALAEEQGLTPERAQEYARAAWRMLEASVRER